MRALLQNITIVSFKPWTFLQDVGKSILESYSRVLESLAYSIGVRIEEVLYMDDISKEDHDDSCSDKLRLLSKEDASSRSAGSLRKRLSVPSLFSVSFSGTSTPYRTPSFSASTPTYSPMPLISPISGGGGERAPFLSRRNIRERCGFGPKKALANYLRGWIRRIGVFIWFYYVILLSLTYFIILFLYKKQFACMSVWRYIWSTTCTLCCCHGLFCSCCFSATGSSLVWVAYTFWYL